MALPLFTSLLLLYTLDSFVAVVAIAVAAVAVVAATLKHMQHAASAVGFAPTVRAVSWTKAAQRRLHFVACPSTCTYSRVCEWVYCFNDADSYAKQNNDNVAC